MDNKIKKIRIEPVTVDNRLYGNENKLLRVASYSRVSTNFDEQLSSFETQKAYYTDLIHKTHGWKYAGTYADEGISGTTEEKRPDFLKMLKHCRSGKIDFIITKSLSRFSRDIVVTAKRVRELKDIGVGVFFEKENINTLEEHSELTLMLLASLAQEESHSLSLNVRKGKQMQMQRGVVMWNYNHNFGYRKGADGQPEVIEEHSKIIKRIFTEYLKGESAKSIADKLSAEKILTAKGNVEWKTSTIQKVIQNERYCGDVILQKTFIANHRTKQVKKNNGEFPKVFIENNHTPIISRELFRQVELERARRSSKRRTSEKAITENGKYSSKYAITDILICSVCGSPYRRTTWTKRNKNGELIERQYVWRCLKRKEHGKKYCKNSITIDEESLHIAISQGIVKKEEQGYEIINFATKEIEKTISKRKCSEFDLVGSERRLETLTNEITELMKGVGFSEKISLITTLNKEAVELKKLVDSHKVKLGEQKRQEVLCELNECLEMKRDELHGYDDDLVRQIIANIKVISQTKLEIQFKDGRYIEQEMKLKVKNRNKK